MEVTTEFSQDTRDGVKDMLDNYCFGRDPEDISSTDPDYELVRNPVNISGNETEYIPDMVYLDNVCSAIGRFADTVVQEIDNLKSSLTPEQQFNKLELVEDNITGEVRYRDTSYDQLRKVICAISSDLWTTKRDGCKPVYGSAPSLKKLIPHLTHIVQDFGIMLALGYHGLEHNGEGGVSQLNKLHSARIRTNDIGFPNQASSRGRDLRRLMIKLPPHITETVIFGDKSHVTFDNRFHNGPPYLTRFVPNLEEFYSHFVNTLTANLVTQSDVNHFADKLSTVLKLRYIDQLVCNNLTHPPNKNTKDHIDIFNKLKTNFFIAIDTINAEAVEGEDLILSVPTTLFQQSLPSPTDIEINNTISKIQIKNEIERLMGIDL